jgi:hypothetical protein
VFGLPALADSLARLWSGRAEAWDRAQRRVALLPGRGACAHPDGAARFVGWAGLLADGSPRIAGAAAVRARSAALPGVRTMRLEIDWTRCDVRSVCRAAAEAIELDEFGYPIIHMGACRLA